MGLFDMFFNNNNKKDDKDANEDIVVANKSIVFENKEKINIDVSGFYKLQSNVYVKNVYGGRYIHDVTVSKRYDLIIKLDCVAKIVINGENHNINIDEYITLILESESEEKILNLLFDELEKDNGDGFILDKIKNVIINSVKSYVKNIDLNEKKKLFKEISNGKINFSFEVEKSKIMK